MNNILNHPVYNKNVLEMITVANDFCMSLGKVDVMGKAALLSYLQKVGPLLYIKGSLLPDIEVSSPDANEKFFTEEKWEWLFNELRKKFKPDDEFWYIDNLEKNQPDPTKGSLAEYFADVFQDMKDFLELYQKNTLAAKENAVYELKKAFVSGWGYKLAVAHKTLHYIMMKGTVQDDLPNYPELF